MIPAWGISANDQDTAPNINGQFLCAGADSLWSGSGLSLRPVKSLYIQSRSCSMLDGALSWTIAAVRGTMRKDAAISRRHTLWGNT